MQRIIFLIEKHQNNIYSPTAVQKINTELAVNGTNLANISYKIDQKIRNFTERYLKNAEP